MCQDCGCSQGGDIQIYPDDRAHAHDFSQNHSHSTAQSAAHSHFPGLTQDYELSHHHSPRHDDRHPHDDRHSYSHPHDNPHSHSHPHDDRHSHPPNGHSHPHPHDDRHSHSQEHLHSHTPATVGSSATPTTIAHGTIAPKQTIEIEQLSSVIPQRGGRVITIEQSVLGKNDRLAAQNRDYFHHCGVVALNLLSSPGSGKTTLLEKTLEYFENQLKIGVIVGDLATDNDAQRLRKTSAPIVQITTGNLCHLEANMVLQAAQGLHPEVLDILVVENVGNLVCPAAYDLGEQARVVLLSVTEGEDKPLKYPETFKSADVVLLTKVDLAEVVGFDRAQALDCIRRVAPQATVLEISARSGEGMADWYRYLQSLI